MISPEELTALQQLDTAITNISQPIKTTTYSNPSNAHEQKETFLASRISNPEFTYRELPYDPGSVRTQLESLPIIGDSILGTILEKRRKYDLLQNQYVSSIGNPERAQDLSRAMYGSPDDSLIDLAREILNSGEEISYTKDIPSDVIGNAIMRTALGYETGAKVQLERYDGNQVMITTRGANNFLFRVPQSRLFTTTDITRLPTHEVGVHFLRGVNGFRQPLQMFGKGLPSYLTTEEGLASYFEEVTRNVNPEIERNYAGRVIAVHSASQGDSFRDTYTQLRDYKFDAHDGWNLSLRAHRAGGFLKDHIYLQGRETVRQAFKDADDPHALLSRLYVGKVGLSDLPMVDQLLQEKVLVTPAYLPDFSHLL